VRPQMQWPGQCHHHAADGWTWAPLLPARASVVKTWRMCKPRARQIFIVNTIFRQKGQIYQDPGTLNRMPRIEQTCR
jgi:hypothetical protein